MRCWSLNFLVLVIWKFLNNKHHFTQSLSSINIMKTFSIFILSFLFLAAAFSQEDAVAKYFAKYIQDDQFEHAYISNRMFSAVLKSNTAEINPRARDLMKDIKGMRMLGAKADGKKYFDEFSKLFESKGFETVLNIKKPGERVNMYIKNEDKPDGELIMIILTENQCKMTSFNGKINLDNMAVISKSLNIQGAEYLEQAKKKQ